MGQLESPDFQRAFVAMSYLAGRRDAELLAPFGLPHDQARALVRRLGHPERERRAQGLAEELAKISGALAARSIK